MLLDFGGGTSVEYFLKAERVDACIGLCMLVRMPFRIETRIAEENMVEEMEEVEEVEVLEQFENSRGHSSDNRSLWPIASSVLNLTKYEHSADKKVLRIVGMADMLPGESSSSSLSTELKVSFLYSSASN